MLERSLPRPLAPNHRRFFCRYARQQQGSADADSAPGRRGPAPRQAREPGCKNPLFFQRRAPQTQPFAAVVRLARKAQPPPHLVAPELHRQPAKLEIPLPELARQVQEARIKLFDRQGLELSARHPPFELPPSEPRFLTCCPAFEATPQALARSLRLQPPLGQLRSPCRLALELLYLTRRRTVRTKLGSSFRQQCLEERGARSRALQSLVNSLRSMQPPSVFRRQAQAQPVARLHRKIWLAQALQLLPELETRHVATTLEPTQLERSPQLLSTAPPE